MDIASSSLEGCQARKETKHEDDSDSMYSGSGEFIPVQVDFFYTVQLRISPEDVTNACDLQRYETVQVDVINTSKSTRREKRTSSNLVSSKYVLRSSLEGARGLRSETVGACETAHTCIDAVHASTERRNNRQRGKETKKVLRDEFFSLRKRFRYLLTRMSYEQSLIDAYSGEGWKGQSIEKIRPKKELQRATSEILRCKLEVRELVKHLDALCAEGKLQASLFDSQGQGHINCEDIFCAKCGLKDSSTNNDIILCDGICERGFHQMCLVPPLLNEEIPPGDEIWLCPGCKCKVYCFDLLNDVQGTQLSILDKWEKVFPETAGDKQGVDYGESDDSEDSDYDPDGGEHNEEVLKECSSSEESDSTSASDGSNNSAKDEQHEGLGFSSDDSEDNDFDPSGLDIDKMVHHEGSSSNESDFSSDSDDLSALGDVNVPADSDKDPLSLSVGCSEPVSSSCKGRLDTVIKEKESSMDSEQLSMQERDLNGKVVLPVSRKRHQEHLDYKKLYDEAYGNTPSDSSEDEDWTEINTPKKVKNDDSENNNVMSLDGNTKTVQGMENFKVPKRMHQKIYISPEQNKDQVGGTGNTSSRIIDQKLESEGTNNSGAKPLEDSRKPDSVGNKATTSGSRCFGKVISQFICFDGGNLVLCDRRGCTKAYHPICVNLDEAIYKGKTPWNCGWHTCSICEKASQYMCYTCTYSLCKGCIKEAGLLCVRGNKGFCETCMKTVMQIEKGVQADKEVAKVDFSDKNSWEYLFKIYWLDLKGKLSLTLEELTKARNPSNGKAFDEGPSHEPCDATDDRGSSSDSSSGLVEGSSSKGKKVKRSSSFTAKGGLRSAEKGGGEGKSVLEDVEWASKELLEFVAHMKDDDTSALSQSDVKALVLKYIKKNNLRDPRKKTQIICDSRLGNLFGKERVGQLEMLKLLEPHFLLKNKTMGGSSNADGIQMEMEGDNDALTNMGSDKRRKSRKRVDERGRLQTNLDDFAAIDVHNINLIYLRRKVLEDMLVDMDKFQEKVVGSFVRIRISGTAQNQDLYRLVQVVGVGKSEVAYKTGRTTEDVTLEILNLNSTEVVSIDTVSNQEFTEEECKQLRQSIKCGHISPLKVGEVQEKARAIQKVRVKDWIESEMSRLSNLRDRASEKGRRKELNECLKKLQLLSTPEQRSRLLEEPPEVHDDPSMDPSNASDDDEGDRYDNRRRPTDAGFSRKGKEPISPGEGGLASNDDWKTDINMSTKDDTAGAGESAKECSLNPGSSSWGAATDLEGGGWNSHLASGSGLSLDATQEIVPVPISSAPISDISDTDKIWHYQDPSGKIQGPFSMAQLHKWNKIGYFPSSLRTWKTSETQDDSILLTDAINGMFPKEPSQWETHVNGFPDHGGTTLDDGKENNQEGGWSGSTSSAWKDKPKNNGDSESNWNNTSGPTNGNAEESKTDPWGTQASAWTSRASEVASSKEEWTGSSSQAWDSSKSHNSGLTPPVNSDTLPLGQNAGNSWNTTRITGFESSNQDFGEPNISKAWETPSSAVAPESTTDVWSVKEGSGNDSSNVPTAPEQGSGWTVGQGAGNKWSAASVQPTGSGWGAISNSGSDGAQQSPHVATNSDKIAPGWGTKVSTSEKCTVGGWDDLNRSPASTHNPTVTLDGGKNDLFIKPAPSPNPGSDGWAGRQGDENKLAGSPATSALAVSENCGVAPNPGSSWEKQSTTSVSDIKKAASMDERNSTLVKSSVEFWGSDALAPSSTAIDTTDILEPMANLVGQSTKKGSNWSTPSASPVTVSSGWGNSVSNAVKDSSQNKLVTPSDNWKSGSPAKLSETGSAIKPSVSPNTGWGTEASAENPDPILGTTPKNSNDGWGASQVMGSGTAPEANANASWGKATQGNKNAGWGASPQGKTDMSWGKAAVQGNANSGWGASQVKSANMGSGAAPEGNTDASWGKATQGNEDAGWGASPQGKTNMSWGKAAVQGNADSGWGAQESTKVGWGGPKGSANAGWGTASQGNKNVGSGGPQASADSGWGTGSQGNTNSGWGASSGNSWGGQQKNTGERFSGDGDRGFHSSDSGQGRGKPSWNRSMSTGDGGSSRPPPRGQRVCKFHESGHCKKGSSCNFLHP